MCENLLKLSTVLKLILLWKTRVENSKNLSRKHPSEKTKVPNLSKKSEPIESKNLNANIPMSIHARISFDEMILGLAMGQGFGFGLLTQKVLRWWKKISDQLIADLNLKKQLKTTYYIEYRGFYKAFLGSLVFVAIFAPIFVKNKKINGWLTLNMPVKASNLLAGEFLGGWWWGVMVWKK